MKTRGKQCVSPKVQRVPVRVIGSGGQNTAMSSTERSKIWRKAIYNNTKLHMEITYLI